MSRRPKDRLKNSSKEFDLSDGAEFLHVYANSIMASYIKYMIAHNIDDDDTENPINQNCSKVNELSRKAYGIRSEEEYHIIKEKLDDLKEAVPNL